MVQAIKSTNMLPGVIRRLRPSELELFREHLLRLDKESRRDRFNGVISDKFLEQYAIRSFHEGATVVGYVEGGRVLGAAELHERPQLTPPTGEIAFSVEKALQHRGLGSRLFERLIAHARSLGYTRLYVTTHPNNNTMRALAAKFAARIIFEEGETVGLIELDPSHPQEDELATAHPALRAQSPAAA
ncbi:GNAT family N-acetyltransferase [Chelativorans oligotrophicus]|uniref:GCN5-related N-acetyltransferase n=1 Tax=Chelativorans sp. (strain BNC1) TaxID=266779 RepID=Q11ID3_CHESB|nr:GNAT family N-acetyltransferase [Chelativorans oligotrophicus]